MKKETENLRKIQTFSEYMRDFLRSKSIRTVVEVGSDVQLRVAFGLAPYCERFCSVNPPEDNVRMKGWYRMHRGMGGADNIELTDGNALRLSELIPRVDVIILHNVLLDITGEDTALMWQYRRGELECSDEKWAELVFRFKRAREEGYKEFLKVARPGYIVTFRRLDPEDDFGEFLTDTLKIDPGKIEKKELLYDDTDNTEELWLAYIINNT